MTTDEYRAQLIALQKHAEDNGWAVNAQDLREALDWLDEDLADAEEAARQHDRELMFALRRAAE